MRGPCDPATFPRLLGATGINIIAAAKATPKYDPMPLDSDSTQCPLSRLACLQQVKGSRVLLESTIDSPLLGCESLFKYHIPANKQDRAISAAAAHNLLRSAECHKTTKLKTPTTISKNAMCVLRTHSSRAFSRSRLPGLSDLRYPTNARCAP